LEWLSEHGRLETSIIAVTSDHGEEFGEHGGFGHARHLHTEVTSVPLVIRPAIPPGTTPLTEGRRDTSAVSIADLPATLVALAGGPSEPQFTRDASSLHPASSSPREIIAEATHRGPKRFALRSGRHRYFSRGYHLPITFATEKGRIPLVRNPIPVGLYDVVADPEEQLNRYPTNPQAAAPLEDALTRFVLRTLRGVLLQCEVRMGQRIEGAVAFDVAPFDEPYAVSPGASVEPEGDSVKRFHVAFGGSGESGIVFPVKTPQVQLNLTLASPESGTRTPLISGNFDLPSSHAHTRLEGADESSHCTLRAGTGAANGGTVVLSPEEREQLRALGYGD
jgi:hypothetical protein